MYAAQSSTTKIRILFLLTVVRLNILAFTYCCFSYLRYLCIRNRTLWVDSLTPFFTQQPGKGPPVGDYCALTAGRVSGEVH